MGAGIWDVFANEYQLIQKNIILMGSGRDTTIFINSHPSAKAVFRTEWKFTGYHFSIRIYNDCDGIIAGQDSGHTDYISDIHLTDIVIKTNVTNTGTPTAITLEETEFAEMEKIDIHGYSHGGIIGLNLSASKNGDFTNFHIDDFETGIIISGNETHDNFLKDFYIENGTIGIDINNGTYNHFHDIFLEGCTTPIDDEIGSGHFIDTFTEHMTIFIEPNDLTGVTVTGGGGANVYGADTIVYDGLGDNFPFIITSISFETSANERYGIRIWVWSPEEGAGSYIFESVLEARFANQIEHFDLDFPRTFSAHSRVFISIKSESGADTMDLWVELIELV